MGGEDAEDRELFVGGDIDLSVSDDRDDICVPPGSRPRSRRRGKELREWPGRGCRIKCLKVDKACGGRTSDRPYYAGLSFDAVARSGRI